MPDNKCLLIVDDSRVSRMMIRAIAVAARPDWNIIEAGNGDEALQGSAGQKVDLAIVDLNMPGMDGLELGGRLKERFPAIAVTLLTANIQVSTQRKAAGLGLHFVKKPVTEEKIKAILDAPAA